MYSNLQTNLVGPKLNFYKSNNLYHSDFNNLNFFENSRFWVFKKYFFTNQQLSNTVVEYSLPLSTTTPKHSNLTDYTNSSLNLNLTSIKTLQYLNNNLTPSLLSTVGVSTGNQPNYLPKGTNPTTLNINLSNLDIVSGVNTNFFYTLTSNPQNQSLGLGYFTNSKNNTTINSSGIKFTN
jgi:hypothetical protein